MTGDIIIAAEMTERHGWKRCVYLEETPPGADTENPFGDDFRRVVIDACNELAKRHRSLSAELRKLSGQRSELAAGLDRLRSERAALAHRFFGSELTRRQQVSDEQITALEAEDWELRKRHTALGTELAAVQNEAEGRVKEQIAEGVRKRAGELDKRIEQLHGQITETVAPSVQAYFDAIAVQGRWLNADRQQEATRTVLAALL